MGQRTGVISINRKKKYKMCIRDRVYPIGKEGTGHCRENPTEEADRVDAARQEVH